MLFRAFQEFQETKVHVNMRWCGSVSINGMLGYQDFPKLTSVMLNYTEIYCRASSSISLNDIDARDGTCTLM